MHLASANCSWMTYRAHAETDVNFIQKGYIFKWLSVCEQIRGRSQRNNKQTLNCKLSGNCTSVWLDFPCHWCGTIRVANHMMSSPTTVCVMNEFRYKIWCWHCASWRDSDSHQCMGQCITVDSHLCAGDFRKRHWTRVHRAQHLRTARTQQMNPNFKVGNHGAIGNLWSRGIKYHATFNEQLQGLRKIWCAIRKIHQKTK